jgi:hypothetical protein
MRVSASLFQNFLAGNQLIKAGEWDQWLGLSTCHGGNPFQLAVPLPNLDELVRCQEILHGRLGYSHTLK